MKFSRRMRVLGIAMTMAMAMAALSRNAWSQAGDTFEVPPPNAPLTAADLERLVGPIALYADDLISVVLPASTYPLQIVQASRFLDALESDSSLQPDPGWDSSVVALLNYPEVLRMLDTNIEWTWALGEAVLDEQPAVMDAIQGFRSQAMLAGNLSSDERQTVSQEGSLIEIAPADPEVIYIPYYEPERVVVVQPRPVVYYYADPYPLYYYPYPYGYRFRSGFFWGVTTAFHIGWHSHVLNVYHHNHYLHPYYGRTYYTPFYARRGVNININLNRANPAWRPRQYRAARPHRVSNGTRITVNREGSRNSTARTRSSTVNRSTRVTAPATQNRSQINRSVTQRQRSATNTRNQPTFQSSNRARVERQGRTQTQRTNRSAVQPQRFTTPQASTQQRSNTQRSTRQSSPALSPQPRTSGRSSAAPARQNSGRQNNSFSSSRQRSGASSGIARSPSAASSRTQSSTRQSGSAGRSSARTGSGTQNGRTRR